MHALLSSTPWPLLLVVPATWLLARSEAWNGPWRTRLDLPLLCGAGVVGGALLGWVFGPRFTWYYPLTASDFDHYCELVGTYAETGTAGFASPRSLFAAQPAALLARALGIVPALALTSAVAGAVLAGGVFLWARSLHGRTAGLLAVLLLGAVAPVGVLARDVSFYPVIVACSVLSAAGVAATFRFRGLAPTALSGLALALLLLADVRGVLWALVLLPLALLGSLLAARCWAGALGRFTLLLAPLALSWWLAHAVVPPGTPGVSNQAYHYVREGVVQAGAQRAWVRDPAAGGFPPSGFVWGVSGPAELVATLRFLRTLDASVPEEVRRYATRPRESGDHVRPWLPLLAVSLAVSAAALARRPRVLLALLGTVAPFLALLGNAARILPQARFLSTSMVVVPLLLAVALAALVEAPAQLGPRPVLPWGLPGRALAVVLVTALALAGIPPNWLGLDAGWRMDQVGQAEPGETIRAIEEGRVARRTRCADLLTRDLQAGRPLRTPLYAYPPDP